nr:hypothetical protein Itr_chr07CG08830 [Ipomoea trifida]
MYLNPIFFAGSPYSSSEDDDIDGAPVLIFFYPAASFSQRAWSNNNDGNSRRAMVSSSLGTSATTAVLSSLFFPVAPSGNDHRRLQLCGNGTTCDSFVLHLLLPGGTVTGGEHLLAAARSDGTG